MTSLASFRTLFASVLGLALLIPAASIASDGKYVGKRISAAEKSGRIVCSPTQIRMTVTGGKINARLTYNNSNLSGAVEGSSVRFGGNANGWSYSFNGKSSANRMSGTWSEAKSGCRGTWFVAKQ